MKRSKIFVIAGLITVTGIGSQSTAIIEHAPKLNVLVNRSFTQSKISLPDDCSGRSDYPHISTHKPGRANVIAETVCPGGRAGPCREGVIARARREAAAPRVSAHGNPRHREDHPRADYCEGS